LDEWIKALKDKDPEARLKARGVLLLLGQKAQPAIRALIEMLNDPDFSVSYDAASVLSKVGKPAVPALLKVLGSDKEAGAGPSASCPGRDRPRCKRGRTCAPLIGQESTR